MSYFKLLRVSSNLPKVRLYSYQWHVQNKYFCSLLPDTQKNQLPQPKTVFILNRQFSLQSTVESFIRTQQGVFKFLSESTPVEYIQKCLVAVHDTSGLPWWSSVIITTIIFRSCVTVPLAIHQYYILAKVENISLELKNISEELKKEVAIAIKLYNWDERTAKFHFKKSLKKQWNNLVVRDNCHPLKAGLLLWFQIPLWICISVSLRNLVYMLPNLDVDAQIRFIQLSVGGFGWIPNLTEADTSFILPLLLGLTNLAIIEIQTLSKVRTPTKFQKGLTNFFRGFSLFMIPISASVPSCLALYWTTSSVFGLVQNLVLLSPKVRRFCKIPETPSEVQNPYNQIAIGFKNRISSVPGLFEFATNKSDKK